MQGFTLTLMWSFTGSHVLLFLIFTISYCAQGHCGAVKTGLSGFFFCFISQLFCLDCHVHIMFVCVCLFSFLHTGFREKQHLFKEYDQQRSFIFPYMLYVIINKQRRKLQQRYAKVLTVLPLLSSNFTISNNLFALSFYEKFCFKNAFLQYMFKASLSSVCQPINIVYS